MIAIKDSEMPSCCANCGMSYGLDKDSSCGCFITQGTNFDMHNSKLVDCPLVEIVTCKDCIHNGTMRCKCFMSDGYEYMSFHNPNFFCADRKRREQDESVD